MASTVAGRRLTEAHRSAQARLSALVATRIRPLWRLIDLADLAGSTPAWLAAVTREVEAQHQTSAELSRRYFRGFRALEVGAPPLSELETPTLNIEALQTSLVAVGPARVDRARRRSEDLETASRLAGTEAARAASRHTLKGGRETVLRAGRSDRQTLGFARATSGSPCYFCALIASRGPVFGSESSADFPAHDGCACTPEPVFSRDTQWPPGSRGYADLYQEAAAGESDPLTAFRRAFEDRKT